MESQVTQIAKMATDAREAMRLSDALARRDPVWWCNRSNKHARGDEGPDGVYCTVRLDVDPEGIRYHLASKWECHWVLVIPLDEFKEWEEVVDSVEVTGE